MRIVSAKCTVICVREHRFRQLLSDAVRLKGFEVLYLYCI